MKLVRIILPLFLLFSIQALANPKGKLFIIGGGVRSTELMQSLVNTAELRASDYIIVLPMATSEPEESFALLSKQIAPYSKAKISSFNFTKEQADSHNSWIDSVRNARLIYVTGGDQNKFMDVVRGTKLYDVLHEAFQAGATIAGTSAGAAIMSEVMITGDQKDNTSAIQTISKDNIITSTGMGFLKNAIIDQHFIYRSRYNRLISVMLDYPSHLLLGIDEGTAIVVKGKDVSVVGDSQVVAMSKPTNIKINKNNKVSFSDAKISLYTAGEYFKL